MQLKSPRQPVACQAAGLQRSALRVELAVADAAGERCPLVRGEGEDGAGPVLRVADADRAVGGETDFDAVVAAAAAAGLAPVGEHARIHGQLLVSWDRSSATAARKSRLSAGV